MLGNQRHSRVNRRRLSAALGCLAGVLSMSADLVAATTSSRSNLEFGRDILPILSENCFKCHGPDDKSRKATLRLDLHDEALKPAKSGERAIVPGLPSKSALLQRINAADQDEVMPPTKSGKKLTAVQKELLQRWIADGAKWGSHWAFEAPVRPEVPNVGNPAVPSRQPKEGASIHVAPVSTGHWALGTHPIDAFIRARLSRAGLRPSPEADKTTLLRRVTLDLLGLPPTPAEVDAFLADKSAGAYDRVVDRLLASAHYGERMALPWLDAARYADSNGFQQDGDTHQYVWRDWVVRSLNANMPFDQFTIEQLAGDLLPDATMDQKIATGFNRCHLLNGEGGAIAEEQRNVVVFDRVDVTATTWLGLTMACAQCHDHKFDPISQRDYYRMFAFFNNVPESGVPSGSGQYRIADPALTTGTEVELARLKALEAASAAAKADADKMERSPAIQSAQAGWEKQWLAGNTAAWRILEPGNMKSKGGATFTLLEDKSVLVSGTNSAQDTYTLSAPGGLTTLTGLRLETIPDPTLPSKGAGRSDSGNAVLTDLRISAGGQKVSFATGVADFTQEGFKPSNVFDDDKASGWAFFPDVATPHQLILQTGKPAELPAGEPLEITLDFQFKKPPQHNLGRFRLSVSTNANPAGLLGLPTNLLAILQTPPEARTTNDAKKLHEYFLSTSPPAALRTARESMVARKKEVDDMKAKLPRVMVMSDAKPRQTRILERGNYEAPRAEVTSGTPGFLPPLPPGTPTNRLGLARWLVSPAHPLTARVQVNRVWQMFFGRGLVKTSENLGTQSDAPSHPDLLDWLAVEFRESGWDVKRLHRQIVTSATYRQSSRVTPALRERDPENQLLARGPRFRLPSLLLRDVALASSGLLDARIGGKPVYPYQPTDIWDGLAITKERDFTYPQSKGADLYRRSLYTFWRRTVAPGNMFDASVRQTCKVRTSITSTPLQALTTLNDVTWVESGRALAERVMKEAGAKPEARLAEAFRRVCARRPAPEEAKVLRHSLDRALAEFRADPKLAEAFLKSGGSPRDQTLDPVEHAAYASVCLAIFNLDEAMTKE